MRRLALAVTLVMLSGCMGLPEAGSDPATEGPPPDDLLADQPLGGGYVLDDDIADTNTDTADNTVPADADTPDAAPETDPDPETDPGSDPGPDDPPADAAPPPPDANAAARAACEKKTGGRFTSTSSGAFVCVTQTRDGGKSCKTAGDCKGACLARSRTCSPLVPLVGCHQVMTRSGGVATVCID